jgi:predicted ATP-grasp superfamily ATP-dependent carboligase
MITTGENLHSISVLIPDDDNTLEIVKALRCLGRDPRITAHVLSNVRSPVSRFCRYCRHLHRHSSENDSQWIEAIESTVRRHKIDVVLPVTLRGVRLISQSREIISKISAIPPLPRYEQIEIVRNKWSLYQFSKQNGLPAVPSAFVGIGGEPISDSDGLDAIEYPALLKPTRQRGGFGIVKVDRPSDLETAWKNENIIKVNFRTFVNGLSGWG